MKELKLRTLRTKHNRVYYYAYNATIQRWQRIKKDVFEDWKESYFGLHRTRCAKQLTIDSREVIYNLYKVNPY